MMSEFSLTVDRINASFMRIPDRLSNPKGESARSEYFKIFGSCILGHYQEEGGLYLSLPFQTVLLTDPVLYIVAGGLLVLDHPIRSGQSEFAINAHIIDLSRTCSLYENRYPRIISCPRKGEEIRPSWMVNRLMNLGFKGPFAKDEL